MCLDEWMALVRKILMLLTACYCHTQTCSSPYTLFTKAVHWSSSKYEQMNGNFCNLTLLQITMSATFKLNGTTPGITVNRFQTFWEPNPQPL